MRHRPLALLLEDEPVVAESIRAMLRDFGCEVCHATDRADALALCARHAPDFALLNFHRMGLHDGMTFARLLQTYFPVKVFFVTGARYADLVASPDFDAAHPVLFKPFTQRQLRRALADLLP